MDQPKGQPMIGLILGGAYLASLAPAAMLFTRVRRRVLHTLSYELCAAHRNLQSIMRTAPAWADVTNISIAALAWPIVLAVKTARNKRAPWLPCRACVVVARAAQK